MQDLGTLEALDLSAPDVLLTPPRPDADPALHMATRMFLQDPVTMEPRTLKLRRHVSPTGINYGYAGTGPGDLAINVLALHLHAPRKDEDHDTLRDGTRVHPAVLLLYRRLRQDLIAPLGNDTDHVLSAERVRDWIRAQVLGAG